MTKKKDLTKMPLSEVNAIFANFEKRLKATEKAIAELRKNPQDDEMDQLFKMITVGVRNRVAKTWSAERAPTEASYLARIYGKKARPVGGFEYVLDLMVQNNEVIELRKLTGGRLFIPVEAAQELTNEELEKLREFHVSDSDVKKYRLQEQMDILKNTSFELSPEEIAEIEREEAERTRSEIQTQLEGQKGLI